jgi:hypothetical protein
MSLTENAHIRESILVLKSRDKSLASDRIFHALVDRVREGRPWISSTELSEIAFVSWSATKTRLQCFTQLGLVCRVGRARATRYRLVVTDDHTERSVAKDEA